MVENKIWIGMKKIMILILMILLVLPLCSASQTSFGTYEKGFCIDLIQTCGECTFNNITSIIYPNATKIVLDEDMTKRGIEYNYTYCFPKLNGEYKINGFGDYYGNGDNVEWVYSLTLTENGKENPTGIVIVLFSILFLIVLAVLIGLLLYTIGHFVEKDFDMKDLIYNLSAYFVIWGIYLLGKEYVGNEFMTDFLEWVISIGAITNVIFPIIIFVISITIWKWMEIGNG